eukprot:1781736-Prymnesium_polylepis.1
MPCASPSDSIPHPRPLPPRRRPTAAAASPPCRTTTSVPWHVTVTLIPVKSGVTCCRWLQACYRSHNVWYMWWYKRVTNSFSRGATKVLAS